MTVYLIGEEGTDLVKIGWTRDSSAKKRLRSLKTSSARQLFIILEFPGAGRTDERKLHEEYKEKRASGEWFHLTEEDLITLAHQRRKAVIESTNQWLESELSKPYLEGYLDLT